ncbi:hypothetical protein GGS23DRAFT_136914 [Durotheca rogersii]|uniref:uncharacterized protein n=1 Tax=Durotheca rogersii TaxID=419775 RepID=UPI00221F4017|nr:uncharacterized protein GGS23DRAFT_136914 [Durotheca rogersii]KAI5861504.1 hypothetical protein GGS23DRAFT_136914 [Durotheca rogersii]
MIIHPHPPCHLPCKSGDPSANSQVTRKKTPEPYPAGSALGRAGQKRTLGSVYKRKERRGGCTHCSTQTAEDSSVHHHHRSSALALPSRLCEPGPSVDERTYAPPPWTSRRRSSGVVKRQLLQIRLRLAGPLPTGPRAAVSLASVGARSMQPSSQTWGCFSAELASLRRLSRSRTGVPSRKAWPGQTQLRTPRRSFWVGGYYGHGRTGLAFRFRLTSRQAPQDRRRSAQHTLPTPRQVLQDGVTGDESSIPD